VVDYKSFLREYKYENRWVMGQDLLFSHNMMNALYDSLQQAYKPENRMYRYDFFRDNCSSKIMDLITTFSENKSAIDSLNLTANISYRTALKHYLKNRPWMMFGVNLLLGPFSDKEISRKQSAFLPDFLMQEIENTGLASKPGVLLDGAGQPAIINDLTTPMIILWMILFFLVIEVFWLKTSKSISDGIDIVLFFIAGILGVLFLTLGFWSDHISLHFNFNLLWANPFLLIVPFTIPTGKTKFNRIFLLLYALLLFFFLINFNMLPQTIPMEAMPIVTILVFRAVNRVFQFRKMESEIE
jgi:hypothetical protein